MEPFATPSDIEAIWRPLTEAEIAVAQARIEQASRLVRREIPLVKGLTVDERITAGLITADDVKDVVTEVVLRTFTLSAYVRQTSVAVDDGSKSSTFDSSVSGKGGVYLTDAEIRTLSGRRSSGGRAFTIVPAPDSRVAPWI